MSGSKKARATSARLFAVQAVYQSLRNGNRPVQLVDEYLQHNMKMDLEGEEMVTPDAVLFKSILAGVTHRAEELNTLMSARMASAETESLLKSILLCGIYEIIGHPDVDAPIIISDYINVAHGFYDGAEPKLVNGVLDAVAKQIRA